MFTNETKQQLIEELKRTPVIEVACQKVGMGRTSYYRFRKQDTEFAKRADEAIAEGRLVVNDLGEAQTISLMKDRDMGAIKFWLTHNDPRYSNKIEINGKFVHSMEELSPEQVEILGKAIRLALPQSEYEPKKDIPEQSEE